jgi:predicted RNA-binding protein with RPS1 domain
LEQQRTYDEKEELVTEGDGCVSKEILIKELDQMFRNFETVKQQIMDLDPNVERSMLVRRNLENGISSHRKMYEEKKKATSVYTTLDECFSTK